MTRESLSILKKLNRLESYHFAVGEFHFLDTITRWCVLLRNRLPLELIFLNWLIESRGNYSLFLRFIFIQNDGDRSALKKKVFRSKYWKLKWQERMARSSERKLDNRIRWSCTRESKRHATDENADNKLVWWFEKVEHFSSNG